MKISSLFKEQNGQFSAMRVALLFSVFVVFGVWGTISAIRMVLQPIDFNITLIIGTVAGGKAMQKKYEEIVTVSGETT
jgi:hypothetical protein